MNHYIINDYREYMIKYNKFLGKTVMKCKKFLRKFK